MNFLNMFKHLLPNARAWRLTVDKVLKQLFEGLSGIGEDVKTFADDVWLDLFPETTRELDAWDNQFGLSAADLTEHQRRDRLAAAWQALGGQSPRYIQDTLQANGFDVYLHSWWEPGTEPAPGVKQCVAPRDPRTWLNRTAFNVQCGEPLAQCGEPTAQCGNSVSTAGYPLVNKLYETKPLVIVQCGEPLAQCGEPSAQCGNYLGFVEVPRTYVAPDDPEKWPYFLYIGGETFGDMAQVEPARKNEFETLCLKICPAQQWLGILVEYL